MTTLRLSSTSVAHSEPSGTTNPRRRFFDWQRSYEIVCQSPRSEEIILQPQEVRSLWDKTVTTSTDGTTTMSLTAMGNGKYRLRYLSGTNPVLRTARTPTVSGNSVTFVVNANNDTVTLTLSGGNFTSIVAGDTVWIPDSNEPSVTSPFNVANQGFWEVMTASSSQLVLRRPDLENGFNGAAETVAVTNANQFRAFSQAGVQIGDQVTLGGGFAQVNHGTYIVNEVTSHYCDFTHIIPLADEASVAPTALGLVFRGTPKRFVQIESNQQVSVRQNGVTTDSLILTPWEAATEDGTATFSVSGPTWSLAIKNLSQEPATILVQSVE